MRKMVLALMLIFVGVSAFAGNTDNLGASGMWDTLKGFLNDTYLTRILALGMFAFGVYNAFRQNFLNFFLMLGLTVLLINGDTIIEKVVGATF